MSFIAIIPARYNATRLPGKIVAPIAGQTLLAHVIAQVRASRAAHIIVATDDVRIADVAHQQGVSVRMTRVSHHSGTSRIGEVVEAEQYADDSIIVNVQGDEPLIAPENINQVADVLVAHADTGMASLYEPLNDAAALLSPHVVKVVVDEAERALYFSRAAIPFDKQQSAKPSDVAPFPYRKHIGLYAYRAGFIRQFAAWQPAAIALHEGLEQLTPLMKGYPVQMAEAVVPGMLGVDTPADLARVEALLLARNPKQEIGCE